SRRFTLLNVFNAEAIASLGTPYPAARAAAAVAFSTLYSPASENSKSDQCSPFCSTDHEVRVGSSSRFVTRQVAFLLVPYRSTGQKARARHRSTLSPVSTATIRPRPGTRFTSRLNAVSTASRSL